MIFHIGRGKYVRDRDVVGVFDMDTATVSRHTRNFLSKKNKEKRVTAADVDIPRSFLLLREDGGRVVLSHISPRALVSRAGNPLPGDDEA